MLPLCYFSLQLIQNSSGLSSETIFKPQLAEMVRKAMCYEAVYRRVELDPVSDNRPTTHDRQIRKQPTDVIWQFIKVRVQKVVTAIERTFLVLQVIATVADWHEVDWE